MKILAMCALIFAYSIGHATNVLWVATKCVGCTNYTQQLAAATTYFNTYINKIPPGYKGTEVVTANLCSVNNAATETHMVIANPNQTVNGQPVGLNSLFYSCWAVNARTGLKTLDTVLYYHTTDTCHVSKAIALVPCIHGSTDAANFRGSTPPVSLPSVKPLAWGTTATQIQQDFALNILYEFETNPNLNALLTNIQPIMLARLSTELKALDSAGHTFWVIVSAAEKVSAANLRLLQSVFGPGPLGWALPYAPPAVQAAYNSLPVRAPLPYSRYAIELGGTALPSVGSMHPYDIFLLQYFCANDIPIVALHKAALYAQVRLKEFWTVLGRILIIVTILDHTEQNWTTELSDWYYLTAHLPYNSPDLNTPFGDTLVLPIPDTTSWPQPIDPEMPFFPPMDFLGDESYCSTDLTEPC